MKTREEIYNEVVKSDMSSNVFIFVDVTDEVEFVFYIRPFDTIMKGLVSNYMNHVDTTTRKVAKTGDFEEDLYYLIDSLIEDAKEAEML